MASPSPRSRTFRLTRRGLVMLVIGAGLLLAAYPTERVELLFLGGFLAAAPLTAYAFVRFRRVGMAVTRTVAPSIAEAGHSVDVSVTLSNATASRTPDAVWRDELPWPPHETPPGRLPSLAAQRSPVSRGTTAQVGYRLVPPRRGVVDLGPFVIDLADAFGLAHGEVVVGETHPLVVVPELVALPETELSIAAEEGAARTLRRQLVGSDDELSTREYRVGDPLRRVHWRASARHGELMVREEEPRTHAEARLLLDTDIEGYPDAVPQSGEGVESAAFEWAVAFTGSVARRLRASGFALRLIETGPRQLASVAADEVFLESLATVDLVEAGRDRIDLAPPGRRQPGAVFAIVSEAQPRVIEALASQRAGFGAAIAFVVDARVTVIESLERAGWLCVDVSSADDPVTVWGSALAGLEVRHGRR